MDKQEFFDRISFPTEYRTRDELKASIILLFITCTTFFILSSMMIVQKLFIFSKTLLLGTIAYEFILFYLLDQYTKKFIEKQIKEKRTRRTLNITSSGIFGILIILTFSTLIYTMLSPTPVTENKFISLSIALLLIVSPTFFWHELVKEFKKKALKKFKLIGLGILLLLAINPIMAQNETMNVTEPGLFDSLNEGLESIEKGVNFVNQVKDFFDNIQSTIQGTLNLTAQQTQIVTIIGILIGAFVLLKFLSVIVKWVIVILVVWIIIQMIFL